MHWLSNPKVRLALIVNGIYFISLVTPTPPRAPSRLFARPFENGGALPAPRRTPVFVNLPPPSGPSKAATWVSKGFDQLDVYLANDLTLVQRPDYRLVLSPAFTTKASNPETPDTVLLRFLSYTHGMVPANTSSVTITADGKYVWDEGLARRYNADSPPGSATGGEAGEVLVTRSINVPYAVFAEIISARKVVIQYGLDRVELTAEQFEALRDMHRRLLTQSEAPPPPPTAETRRPHRAGTGAGPGPLSIRSAPPAQPPAKRQ